MTTLRIEIDEYVNPVVTVFDLEFNSGRDGVDQYLLEIGAVTIGKAKGSGCVWQRLFHTLVKPPAGVTLDNEIVQLTGIDAKLLEDHGIPCEQAMANFAAFVGGTYMAAWGDDMRILLSQQERLECGPVFNNAHKKDFFNLKAVVKTLFGNSTDYASIRTFAENDAIACLRRVCPHSLCPDTRTRDTSLLPGVRLQRHCALVDAMRDSTLMVNLMRRFRVSQLAEKLISDVHESQCVLGTHQFRSSQPGS